MPEEPSKNNEPPVSKKYWLRALIIIAIGVPVILEFLTFFNLIKFRLWDEKETARQEEVQPEGDQLRKFSIGDTLLVDSGTVVTLEEMQINVSPESWKFEVKLRAMGTVQSGLGFDIDSVGLETGIRVPVKQVAKSEVEIESGSIEMEGEWVIPNREVPNELFITFRKRVSEDSVINMHKRIPINKPAVRYHKE
ncbi:MAG: hypothetical protein PVH63_01810 [Balneolaceae bacterium]|jgi:hypothetical protein